MGYNMRTYATVPAQELVRSGVAGLIHVLDGADLVANTDWPYADYLFSVISFANGETTGIIEIDYGFPDAECIEEPLPIRWIRIPLTPDSPPITVNRLNAHVNGMAVLSPEQQQVMTTLIMRSMTAGYTDD